MEPVKNCIKPWSFAEHEGSLPADKLLSFSSAAGFEEKCNIWSVKYLCSQVSQLVLRQDARCLIKLSPSLLL